MKGKEGADKEEVERREKELGEKVDKILGLAEKQKSTERSDFENELKERLESFEAQMKDFGRQPVSGPRGATSRTVKAEDKYDGDNLFLDMKEVAQKGARGGMREKAEAIAAYEEKFNSPERLKAWASGDLEEVDLILPDIQQALPFLRAQAKAVQLFREIRTSSPSVEFPVFKTGLTVEHVKDAESKPESEPEFDLEVARVFTIAGISDVPNPTLEDFPAARGWIATELGAATGAQEEVDVLTGSGEGEPLGLYENEDIPTRAVDVNAKASLGRLIITSAFRAAQQVRIKGFMEPTDILLNPAAWTDVALSFEDTIGFLYGAPNAATGSGPVADAPPPRILGLPVTWSSYVPAEEGGGEDETSIVVGNFNDGIVLRRSPFRIDIDTSIGFKKNLTSFRGEERMGFIVVRPKSFVRVTGIKPSPVE
jgi:HK97 family phage major capsid protein